MYSEPMMLSQSPWPLLGPVEKAGQSFVQDFVNERAFAAARNAGDANKLPQWYLDIDVFQVVLSGTQDHQLFSRARAALGLAKEFALSC